MKTDDAFVKQYAGLVRTIASKVRAQMDLTCELDDLIAFGTQGLIEAASRFDESRGIQFNTFAYYRIRGAIIREIARRRGVADDQVDALAATPTAEGA